MEVRLMGNKMVRLAIFGAIFFVATDYFLKPSLSKTFGVSA